MSNFELNRVYATRDGEPTQVVWAGEVPGMEVSALEGTSFRPRPDQIVDTDTGVLFVAEGMTDGTNGEDPLAASFVPDPIVPQSKGL